MTETKQQTLAELERLEKEATPGPWEAFALQFVEGERPTPEQIGEYVRKAVAASARESGSDQYLFVSVEKPDGPADVCHVGNGPTSPQNTALIVALRNHALPLLREQGEEIERLKRTLRAIADSSGNWTAEDCRIIARRVLARRALGGE